MDELDAVLSEATRNIDRRYFMLDIHGGEPRYRERVYCYELYHQMRLCWSDSRFLLNGELDKVAHPTLPRLRGKAAKPDLLVHEPGTNSNHAVIEVKAPRANRKGIRSDLEKLSLFLDEARYQRAIYLLYGRGAVELASRVRRLQREIVPAAAIEIWVHAEHSRPATPALA